MTQTLNIQTTARLLAVLNKAARCHDVGVVEWVDRAFHDAKALGRLRDRDVEQLARLERTYNDEYYARNTVSKGNFDFPDTTVGIYA